MNVTKINFISYFFQLLAGVLLVIESYPKLMMSPESMDLFQQLGVPYTSVFIGFLEIIAAIFLIFNFIPHIGALISFSVMLGAIIAHSSVLGTEVHGDGGRLLMMLIAVLFSSLIVMYINIRRMPFIGSTL
jgi:uncharacterized membrane protein YphA (DoxX/SURF4 family)